jgi:hypothetical protein
MKSTSYDGAIVEVTDVSEGGDVRGPSLAEIMELGMVKDSAYHTETFK